MRWARYAVEKVRYDESGTRIIKVLVHPIRIGVKEAVRVWPRERLASALEMGYDVIVVPHGKPLAELDSRRVPHLSLNGSGFIRIDGGESPADCLGDLPDL